MRVLIVDDQRSARRVLAELVGRLPETEVREAATLGEARLALQAEPFDVALVDLRLGADPGNRDGIALVGEIRRDTGAVPVVVSGYADMAEIRAAMRLGAFDYILKEELCEELVLPMLEELRSRRRLQQEVVSLRARVAPGGVPGLVGTSPAMQRLRAAILRVALSDRPVLLRGPTGSGKELVARALHALGPHPDEPLLDVNCGAIPEALMESQLFGHERGAFTGADRRQEGYLSAVRRGTLFLDEVAELSQPLQVKLLRVLESGRFRTVGSPEDRAFEGRVVAATNADLERRVAAGAFREDLFYRLNVLELQVPGIDERREDVPALVAHFAARQARPLRFTAEAIARLMAFELPGNVRQLRNIVDRIAVFAEADEVGVEAVDAHAAPRRSGGEATSATALARALLRGPIGNKLEAAEEALVREAMALAEGNKSAAARLLGVHRKFIERWLSSREVRYATAGVTHPREG